MVTPYFNSFIFDRNYLIGMIVQDTVKIEAERKDKEKYFILNFRDGKIETALDSITLFKKLDVIKFSTDREFITIRKYSWRY